MGAAQLHAVPSFIIQALLHDLKAEAGPLLPDVPHWRAEARGFSSETRDRFTPSMRQRLDIEKLYRDAVRRMPETIDTVAPLPVPDTCPVTLDELLAAEP